MVKSKLLEVLDQFHVWFWSNCTLNLPHFFHFARVYFWTFLSKSSMENFLHEWSITSQTHFHQLFTQKLGRFVKNSHFSFLWLTFFRKKWNSPELLLWLSCRQLTLDSREVFKEFPDRSPLFQDRTILAFFQTIWQYNCSLGCNLTLDVGPALFWFFSMIHEPFSRKIHVLLIVCSFHESFQRHSF